MNSQAKENFNDAIAFLKNNGQKANAEIILDYVQELGQEIERLSRKEKLSTYIYPHNAFIHDDQITFCYDASQRKALGKDDKWVFEIKSISKSRLVQFVKENAKDLNLYPWIDMEGGSGYYSNTIDRELYNQCFTVRLSECLFKMIESDNDLKLSLMKSEFKQFYQRNR